MKMSKISHAFSTRAAAFAVGAALSVAAVAPVTANAEALKLAHFVPPQHTFTGAIVEPFKTGVEKDTGGELEVQVFPGGELGKGPVEQYVRAVSGVADIVWGLAGYTSSQFPLSMISEMPGVVDTTGLGYEKVWSVYEQYLKGEFPGTRPLALWVSEPNVLIMKSKEIRTVADMKGLKIRVSGSVPGQLIEALGAIPVQMPAPQMYNALDTGLIDGILTGGSAIGDFRLNEVANVYTEGPNLGNILFYVVMNEAKYQSLSDAEKAAIDAHSGMGLSKSGEDNWNAAANKMLAALKADPNKKVISLSAEEAAPFNEITYAVTDKAIAELDAQGLPATEVMKAMQGGM